MDARNLSLNMLSLGEMKDAVFNHCPGRGSVAGLGWAREGQRSAREAMLSDRDLQKDPWRRGA